MRAENPIALEHARGVFRDKLIKEPNGPYADHYRRALEYVERRIATTKRAGHGKR